MDSRTRRDLIWERNRPLVYRLRRRAFIIFEFILTIIINIVFYDKIYEYNHMGRKPKEGEFI